MELLLEQRVSGVFMTYLKGEGTAIETAQRAGVPLVGVSVIDRRLDSIVSDDAVGARLAVEHLKSLGHVRIAYVPSQRTEPPTNASRMRGLRAAQRGAGLPPGVAVAIAGAPGRNQRPLSAVIHDGDRPTAFLAGNDVTALELIERLEAAGVRVPDDASVIGCDDIPLARLGRVSLTTLHQPIAELAALGVARMLARIEVRDGPAGAPLQVRLAPELIVRGTTAPA
jgi:DNA-binding LacI/PurR family transcriptional regulator